MHTRAKLRDSTGRSFLTERTAEILSGGVCRGRAGRVIPPSRDTGKPYKSALASEQINKTVTPPSPDRKTDLAPLFSLSRRNRSKTATTIFPNLSNRDGRLLYDTVIYSCARTHSDHTRNKKQNYTYGGNIQSRD